MKKAIDLIANAILVIAVLLLLLVTVAPRFTGLTLEPVLSGSMEPTIKTGALIAIAKADPGQIKVGDIIGFHVAGMDTPVSHRVIELVQTDKGPTFMTKGDANSDADAWVVNPQDIIGKVYFHISSLGYVAKFIKTPSGFAIMMGLPALAIVAMELKSLLSPAAVKRTRHTLRHKPSRLPLYLPFAGGLIAVGILWGIMAGSATERTLGSLGSAGAEEDKPGYVAQRTMQNKGKVPLVICLSSDDPTVSFSETYFSVSPGKQKKIEIAGADSEAVIRTGGYLPMLPAGVIYDLFRWNPRLSPALVALVWVLPITLAIFFGLRTLAYRPRAGHRVRYLRGALTHG